MSKRAAAVQLTSENVDEQDNITEEAGEFQVANEEEIQRRVIKKAKRGRGLDQGSSEASGTGGIFAGLSKSLAASGSSANGTNTALKLGMPSASGGLKLGMPSGSGGLKLGMPSGSGGLKLGMPSGSGGLKLGMPSGGSTGIKLGGPPFEVAGGSTGLKLGMPSSTGLNFPGSHEMGPLKPLASTQLGSAQLLSSASTVGTSAPGTSHSSEYLQQLSSLNTSVSQWISRHVGASPYVDLTPIFRDYEAHLRNIDTKYNPSSGTDTESGSRDMESDSRDMESGSHDMESGSRDMEPGSHEVDMQQLQSSSSSSSSEDSEPRNESDGSSNVELSTTETTPRESPDKTVQLQTPPTPPPSLASSAPTTTSASDDDCLLSVRTKLFYKKEADFVEVGVGTLRVQSSSKGTVHLLMRNDTSIGTVMLNVKVSGSNPLSSNKKSVLLVCPTPNPPLSVGEGPVTYLLRVKTEESAEELLGVIKDGVKE